MGPACVNLEADEPKQHGLCCPFLQIPARDTERSPPLAGGKDMGSNTQVCPTMAAACPSQGPTPVSPAQERLLGTITSPANQTLTTTP